MKGLSSKQDAFCLLIATGELSDGECYAKAFGCTIVSGRVSASRLLKNPEIQERVTALRYLSVSPERKNIKDGLMKGVNDVIAEAISNSEEVQHLVNGVVQKLHRLSATLLTVAERRAFLAMVVRTPLSEIDENSPLCQSFKVTKNEFGGSTEYKMVDKLRASELDAKMAGELVESGTTVNLVENKAIIVNIPASIARPRGERVIEV